MEHIFSASERELPGMVVIDLQGEINAFADQELSAAYERAEGHATPTVVLNFKEVSYINSTGIALIVGLLARARKAGRRLAVYGLSDHYQEIFQITRLADFMNIYSDEASLVAELS
ncbi:MAG: STAS domain-containing protein [Anaerolineales bacterium]|nr:MAG: STAS domain-containing protein [Anaerolineales bacterium]